MPATRNLHEPDRVTFYFAKHNESGLWMARCHEFPGVIVHGYSVDELVEHIPSALRSYVRETTGAESDWHLSTDSPPGFVPPSYVAQRAAA